MTIQIPDDLARRLEGIAAAQQKSVEQVALDSLRSLFDQASSPEIVSANRSGSCLIQVRRQSMILRPRLPLLVCPCATGATSTTGRRSDLFTGHKRDQRFDASGSTNRDLDGRVGLGRSRGYLCDRSRRDTLRYRQTARRQTSRGVGRDRPSVFGCLPVRTGPGTGGRLLRGGEAGSATARPQAGRKRPMGGRDGTCDRCDTRQPRQRFRRYRWFACCRAGVALRCRFAGQTFEMTSR